MPDSESVVVQVRYRPIYFLGRVWGVQESHLHYISHDSLSNGATVLVITTVVIKTLLIMTLLIML